MKQQTLLSATLAAALLAACGDKPAENAPQASAPAAAPAPAPAQATAPAPAPAPAPEQADASEKMNAYIECYNRVGDRALSSIQRYASWIKDIKAGPTGKEQNVYGLYTLNDSAVSDCNKNITAALAQAPALPELDAAAKAYLDALLPLNERINEADTYYSRENYKDDAFAKGKQMHGPLLAAMDSFRQASRTFSDALEVENTKRQQAQLKEVEASEGRKLTYWRLLTMLQAKQLVNILAEESFDVEKAGALLAEYEKAADELDAYAKANESELPMTYSSFMPRTVEAFRVAAKERFRRVRDKTPYSTGERMNMGGAGEWMVSGSPGKLVRAYNELVDASNRF